MARRHTACFPGSASRVLVYLTVRGTFASRYGCVDVRPGAACQVAVQEKATRYQGMALPVVYEALGRLDPSSTLTLQALAAEAEMYGCRLPGTVRGRLRELQVAFKAAHARAMADIVLISLVAAGPAHAT